MKLAVRCIYFMPVEPTCDIIDISEYQFDEFYRMFLEEDRIRFICTLTHREAQETFIKEIAWVILDHQNKVVELKPKQSKVKAVQEGIIKQAAKKLVELYEGQKLGDEASTYSLTQLTDRILKKL